MKARTQRPTLPPRSTRMQRFIVERIEALEERIAKLEADGEEKDRRIKGLLLDSRRREKEIVSLKKGGRHATSNQ